MCLVVDGIGVADRDDHSMINSDLDHLWPWPWSVRSVRMKWAGCPARVCDRSSLRSSMSAATTARPSLLPPVTAAVRSICVSSGLLLPLG